MPTLKELLAAKNAARRVGGGSGTSARPEQKMPIANAEDDLDPRELASEKPGQNLPDEWPGAGEDDFFWKQAYTAFATELAIVREPAPSAYGWIAVVRKEKNARPILLARLPLAGGFNPADPF
jgi:hypothetical protein